METSSWRAPRLVAATAGLALLGALLFFIALAMGGDEVVPCDLKGLNRLLGDQVNHIDGDAGFGGCIVPTTGAWTAAIICGLLPMVVGAALMIRRHRSRS